VNQDLFIPGEEIEWKQAWKSSGFRLQFLGVVAVIIGLGFATPHFFDFIESRNGPVLPDPVLDLFPRRDVSWLVFFILYSGVIIGLYLNLKKPIYLLLTFQIYALVMFMRCFTLTVWPLNPPVGYIPLREPIVQMFFTSDGRIISKDLFFSGHMSTMLAIVFSMGHTIIRRVLVVFAITLAMLLLIQHVHYTIDVLAAPLGAWLGWWISKNLIGRISIT